MSSPFSRIIAASVDGRAHNTRYRQTQFQRFHAALLVNASALKDAIRADTGVTSAEAEVEYLVALFEVRKHYEAVSLEKDLDEEYSVAKGKDALERRVPVGIVFIAPNETHSSFFSVVSPLSAALAAGNCVVVELHNTIKKLPSILRKILPPAFDSDIFAITDSRPDDAFLSKTIQVLQSYVDTPSASPRIVSPSTYRTVAIVDRTANVEEAAAALVQARFAFGGRGPYAPDSVLVNEFVMQQFLTAVVQHSSRYLAESANGTANGSATRGKKEDSVADLVEKAGSDARVVVSGANGSVVEISNRNSPLLTSKIGGKLLNVHAITSLDDAIDFANSNNSLAATFAFGDAATAKYLTQFIDAEISFVNHIPVELLVGPAIPLSAPSSTTPALTPRYSTEHFTIPHPIQASPATSSLSVLLSPLLLSPTDPKSPQNSILSKAATKALGVLTTPLPPTGQRPGHKIGFFEQGILTGLVLVGTPALMSIGFLGWGAFRAGKAVWAKI